MVYTLTSSHMFSKAQKHWRVLNITAIAPCLLRLQRYFFLIGSSFKASITFTGSICTSTENLWAQQIDDKPASGVDDDDNKQHCILNLNFSAVELKFQWHVSSSQNSFKMELVWRKFASVFWRATMSIQFDNLRTVQLQVQAGFTLIFHQRVLLIKHLLVG